MIEGVGEIHVFGFRDRNVRVWYDAPRLEAHGLTVLDVNRAIAREHQEVPAGRIEGAEREMNVRAQGEAIDISAFRDLVVTYAAGAPIRLKDVAVVEDGLEDRRRLMRAMGETSIGFGITKLRGANAVQVGRDVKAKMVVLKSQLPEGLKLDVNWDTTTFIERSIHEILFTLVLAALLTGLVCWLFLGSWSTTVNILLAIPTSILGTFIVIYFLGFTLNTYTVLGLTLVVGIVVDDAIMVLENIYRHREMGEGKVKAASVGAREITFAAAATTLAIVAIFLPVAFLKGIIGKFFFQFGVTISVAVLISLLEALTLAPMRCSQFLEIERRGRVGQAVDGLFTKLSALYLRALGPVLRHRGRVLLGSLAFFLLSLGTIFLLRQEFIPSQDMSRFTIRLQTPVGTSLDATDRYFRQIETVPHRAPRGHALRRERRRRERRQLRPGLRQHEGAAGAADRPGEGAPADAARVHGRRQEVRRHRPGRPDRPAGHLADRIQPLAGRRLPDRVQHPGPRLERPRQLLARRSPSRCGSRASSPTSTPTTRWGCPRSRSSPTATGPRTSG